MSGKDHRKAFHGKKTVILDADGDFGVATAAKLTLLTPSVDPQCLAQPANRQSPRQHLCPA
jgi:hypothetical protein